MGLGGLETRNRGNNRAENDMLSLLRGKEYNGMEIISKQYREGYARTMEGYARGRE